MSSGEEVNLPQQIVKSKKGNCKCKKKENWIIYRLQKVS